MSRSKWKGPFSQIKVKTKTPEKIKKTEQSILLRSRASMVLPYHLGSTFLVYNGKNWVSVKIVEDMIGHKYGEFASTRKKAVHKLKKAVAKK